MKLHHPGPQCMLVAVLNQASLTMIFTTSKIEANTRSAELLSRGKKKKSGLCVVAPPQPNSTIPKVSNDETASPVPRLYLGQMHLLSGQYEIH